MFQVKHLLDMLKRYDPEKWVFIEVDGHGEKAIELQAIFEDSGDDKIILHSHSDVSPY